MRIRLILAASISAGAFACSTTSGDAASGEKDAGPDDDDPQVTGEYALDAATESKPAPSDAGAPVGLPDANLADSSTSQPSAGDASASAGADGAAPLFDGGPLNVPDGGPSSATRDAGQPSAWTRPLSVDCVAPPRPQAPFKLTSRFEVMPWKIPTSAVITPERRWYFTEQNGLVWTFVEGEDEWTRALDYRQMLYTVSPDVRVLAETGMLSIALHPNFAEDNRIFIAYSAPGRVLRISSFRPAADGIALDANSEVVVIDVPKGAAQHWGGDIAFGPDGYLYVSVGDGGFQNDINLNGQNPNTLEASILRLDVSDEPGYTVPADNPFVGTDAGAPEVFAYGLRNPWRMSFDAVEGTLWVGDVGQAQFEEVNQIVSGGNYGWRNKEGSACYIGPCQDVDLIDPVFEYGRDDGASVIAGYTYRGSAIPELSGMFLLADYVSGNIWALQSDGDSWETAYLLRSTLNITNFVQDLDGELYVLDHQGGAYQLTANEDFVTDSYPARLQDTGCFTSNVSSTTTDVLSYDIAVPFWSDGLRKERAIALPNDTQVEVTDDGDLLLPPGAVTLKSFYLEDTLVETRLYVRHFDGEHTGFSYAWAEDGQSAELVEESFTRTYGDYQWEFIGPGTCNQCHNAASGFFLGLTVPQLNLERDAGGSMAPSNQVNAWQAIGFLPDELPELAPFAQLTSLDDQARAYLDVNCSHCHRPAGPARGNLDLRFQTPLASTGVCSAPTFERETSPGAAQVVAAGQPELSELLLRMSDRELGSMPPLASQIADEAGAQLLEDWITEMIDCPEEGAADAGSP